MITKEDSSKLPSQRFLSFLHKFTVKRLLPEYSKSTESLIIPDARSIWNSNFEIENRLSGRGTLPDQAETRIFVGHKSLRVTSGESGAELNWDKAWFVLPFKNDALIDEMIVCGTSREDWYIRRYVTHEAKRISESIFLSAVIGILLLIGLSIGLCFVLIDNIWEYFIHYWYFSWIIPGALFYISAGGAVAIQAASKALIQRKSNEIVLNKIGNLSNFVKIELLNFSVFLPPGSVDANFIKELIVYGCKARDKMYSTI